MEFCKIPNFGTVTMKTGVSHMFMDIWIRESYFIGVWIGEQHLGFGVINWDSFQINLF